MAGAVLALLAGGTAGGGGGALTLDWANIYGLYTASNAPLAVSGLSGPISLEIANSGAGLITYTRNGVSFAYGGAFTVANGDMLGWSVTNAGDGGAVSGTVSVLNESDGGATVGAFTYVVRNPGGGFE